MGCTAFRVTNRQFTRCVTRVERPWAEFVYERKPTKTAVSGCNFLDSSANFADPISRLDPNKRARVTYREMNSPFQTWPFWNDITQDGIIIDSRLFYYREISRDMNTKFQNFSNILHSSDVQVYDMQILRCFWFIRFIYMRFITDTKRLFVYRSWNVTVSLFRNTSGPFYKLNRDESDGSRIKRRWFMADSIPISLSS